MGKNKDAEDVLPEGFDTTVTVILDDQKELECAVVSIFDAPVPKKFGEGRYIALLPLDNPDGDEVYLYRYSESEDGSPSLDNINDDEEYDIVSDAFDEVLDAAEYDELLEDEEDEE
ncbi:MAG: DUF1292 domain-containing protein [Lachnospiraceae bacterium]|nr:DUF1292 domain-containing protein [Lachnospiraceae bacterium]